VGESGDPCGRAGKRESDEVAIRPSSI